MNVYSFLNEIKVCSGRININFEKTNSNIYRLISKESDNEISAYYFSCPIYRNLDKKIITFDFEQVNGSFIFNGINANIEVGRRCIISNQYGELEFGGLNISSFQKVITRDIFGELRVALFGKNDEEEILIYPTSNGIAVQITEDSARRARKFKINMEKKYLIGGNGRFAALMIEECQPFATINAMCLKSEASNILLPIYCKLVEDKSGYLLNIDFGKWDKNIIGSRMTYIFTLDLYAAKSIFDTTVESGNPDINNSYGSIAYIGNSDFFKEQWLYTRIDVSQILDLRYFSVKKATLYSKRYGGGNLDVNIARINAPWCSFGNTWNTKVETGEILGKASLKKSYISADITKVVRKIFNQPRESDAGVVLKPDFIGDKNDAIIFATADNYFTPQILEIKLLTD